MDPGCTRELLLNSPMFSMCSSAQSSLDFLRKAKQPTSMKPEGTDIFPLSFMEDTWGSERLQQILVEHKKPCGKIDVFGDRSMFSDT